MAKNTKSTKTEVKLDRRTKDERRRAENPAKAPVSERRKVHRRRQIDPTTCERDYSQDEIEFMQAMDAYKRSSGRMFPTCSEILEVVRSLGYLRPDQEVASVEIVDASTEHDDCSLAEGLTEDIELDDAFDDDLS